MAKTHVHDATTQSVDDYLKALFHLGLDGTEFVSGRAIAHRLDVSSASVTNMMQRLAAGESPLVIYERHGGARLSGLGRLRALEIIRHHRLLETFLHHELSYPVDEIHEEAERLEHFISEGFERRVAEKLGNPQSDPHGHCIPAVDGSMPTSHGVTCCCRRSA